MNDLQIQCFLVAAKHMNFSKAAEELFISQPAVSRHIINLEKELNSPLFDRAEKPIAFTPAGKEYFDFFTRMSAEFDALKHEYGMPIAAPAKRLTIALNSIWSYSDTLAAFIHDFQVKHPEISVTFNQYLSTNIISSFSDDTADILIHMTNVISNASGYDFCPIGYVKNTICYSDNNPCAAKGHLKMEDFVDASFVYTEDGNARPASQPHIKKKIFSLFPESLRGSLRFVTAPNSDIATSLVEDGVCVILLDEWARLRTRPGIQSFTTDFWESVSFGWRKDARNSAVDMFVRDACDYFRDHPLSSIGP